MQWKVKTSSRKTVAVLEHAKRFSHIALAQGHEHAKIMDLNFLFSTLAGVMNIQDRLSTKAGWTGSLYAKARLLHVWRMCPFIDLDVILDEFEAHGVPMCLHSNIEIWPGSGPETFLRSNRTRMNPQKLASCSRRQRSSRPSRVLLDFRNGSTSAITGKAATIILNFFKLERAPLRPRGGDASAANAEQV